jgi:hypothetical protein
MGVIDRCAGSGGSTEVRWRKAARLLDCFNRRGFGRSRTNKKGVAVKVTGCGCKPCKKPTALLTWADVATWKTRDKCPRGHRQKVALMTTQRTDK